MHATLTDDADRMPYGCDQFPEGDDYDPMNSRDYEPSTEAPNHEDKPYGWGIESFEDPALDEANSYVRGLYFMTGSMYRTPTYSGAFDARRDVRDTRWRANTKLSKRRLRHSEIVWGRLCDECKTHVAAVAKYEEWAKRSVGISYRDERGF